MANPKASRSSATSESSPAALTTLEAEIAELRAALAEQRAAFTQVIEQQQTAITDLRQAVAARLASEASLVSRVEDGAPVVSVVPIVEADAPQLAATAAAEPEEEAAPRTRRNTSRRGLLRGAAAGAAAAAVAAVAVGGAQSAHAAPLATGNSWTLGNANDADATTSLSPSASSAPNPLLRVDNSANLASAIVGYSQTYFGAVVGSANSGGTGVWGVSDSGSGVIGVSSSGPALNAVGAGRIAQNPQSSAGAPTGTGTGYSKGEQIRDSNGELWICTASGAPGTWARVAHVDAGGVGGAITFLSKPIRLLDTRLGQSAAIAPGAKLTAGDHYFPVNGTNYNSVLVSNNATGIVGNLTVLNATASGYIAVCPANVGFSGTANLAFNPGQVLSNSYTTAVGLYITGVYPFFQFHTGIDIYVNGASLDVIIDIMAVVL